MIAALDSNILLYLLDEKVSAPLDKATGQPVARCKDRVTHLIAAISRDRGKIVIPTPVLAEISVKAGAAGPAWLSLLKRSRYFRVAPFDERAAVECAARRARRMQSGGPRGDKANFDEQIVAIAVIEQASTIYSDDPDVVRLAGPNIPVIGVAALPLPPEDPQQPLPFDDLEPEPAPPGLTDEVDQEQVAPPSLDERGDGQAAALAKNEGEPNA